MNFEEHELVWTAEKVKRFWAFYSRLPGEVENFFARQVGDAVINMVRSVSRLQGSVLDYGAGDGSMTERLLELGAGPVYACENHAAGVEALNKKFASHPLFKGAFESTRLPTTPGTNSVDAVFMLEVIEHLDGEAMAATLRMAQSVLRPGGLLAVTTPNDEDLDGGKVLCPDCGAVFHKIQHVKRFDSRSLTDLLGRYGFKARFCDAVQLADYKPGKAFRRWLKQTTGRAARQPRPNLVFVGTKT
jgi:2-polyprenyl-3-methyl-5-hydroxy-6-metoxy-1,4-benzoquinol methylase